MNRNSFKWYREIYGTKYKNNVFSDGNIKPTIYYNDSYVITPTNIRYNENYRIIDHINGLGQVSYNFPCLTNTVHIHFKMYASSISNATGPIQACLIGTTSGWCLLFVYESSIGLKIYAWHASKTFNTNIIKSLFSYLWSIHTYDFILKNNIVSLYINNSLIGSLNVSSLGIGNIADIHLPNINTNKNSYYMNAYVYLQDVFIDNTGSYYYTPDEYYLQRELTPYEIMENNDISYGN